MASKFFIHDTFALVVIKKFFISKTPFAIMSDVQDAAEMENIAFFRIRKTLVFSLTKMQSVGAKPNAAPGLGWARTRVGPKF